MSEHEWFLWSGIPRPGVGRGNRYTVGVQASLIGGVQASPSTAHGAGTSRITTEMRTKHRDDLANVKSIPSILFAYIPPLSGTMNMDSVPRDF
jgi:hypothetical protein